MEDVCLELHEEVVLRCAAVHVERLQGNPGVVLHGARQVAGLVGERFERSARYVGGGGAARETADEPARVRLPPGRAQPGERGDDVDATRVRHALRQKLRLLDAAN